MLPSRRHRMRAKLYQSRRAISTLTPSSNQKDFLVRYRQRNTAPMTVKAKRDGQSFGKWRTPSRAEPVRVEVSLTAGWEKASGSLARLLATHDMLSPSIAKIQEIP